MVEQLKPCPRCGASPSHQKFRRSGMSHFPRIDIAEEPHPVDGVVCPHCENGFRVTRLETFDDGRINLSDEFECEPSYCPHCGARIVEGDEES